MRRSTESGCSRWNRRSAWSTSRSATRRCSGSIAPIVTPAASPRSRSGSPASPRPTGCAGTTVGNRLREEARVRAAVEAAEHDAVALVVEERDREALVGSGVLERVEAHEADVLEAAPAFGRSMTACIASISRMRSVARDRLLGAADQPVVERAALVVAHQLAVVAHCPSQPGALDGEADDEQEHDMPRARRRPAPGYR